MDRADVLMGQAGAAPTMPSLRTWTGRDRRAPNSRLNLVCDRLLPVLWVASACGVIAIHEWLEHAGRLTRHPWGYTILAAVTAGVLGFQFWRTRGCHDR